MPTALEELGRTWVKLGQALALRELVPKELPPVAANCDRSLIQRAAGRHLRSFEILQTLVEACCCAWRS